MKVLLLGDYSSLHLHLRDGLRELGYEAVLASHGDGWKQLPQDILIGSSGTGAPARLRREWSFFQFAMTVSGYDVVQFINPSVFGTSALMSELYMRRILSRNGRSFVLAAGDDAYYWAHAEHKLEYTPFADFLAYDNRGEDIFWRRPSYRRFNEWLVGRVDGIIPVIYDLYCVYAGERKLRAPIPLPVNVSGIPYRTNQLRNGKLVVFHGLNREGFKGTRHVRAAFDIIAARYPNDIEVVIDGRMPYDSYLNLMARVNVVVDQTNTYGYGMNACLALAMGKVVLSGAEAETLRLFGFDDCPVVNIRPDPQDIVRKLEALMDARSQIGELGDRGRQFAERYHDHVRVAAQYATEWNR